MHAGCGTAALLSSYLQYLGGGGVGLSKGMEIKTLIQQLG